MLLEDPGAVRLEASKAPACDEAFERLAVDHLRVDARGEIREVCERLVAAHLDQVLDRLRADALQRGERVDDLAVDARRRRRRSG